VRKLAISSAKRLRVQILTLIVVLAPAVACALQSSQEQTREGWQNVPDILEALNVEQGSAVADIGAGRGFFTVRLARAVGPDGHVFAVDISSDDVRRLRERVRDEKLQQVDVIEGETDDPKLSPSSIDAALIVNAYHEMRRHQAMLAGIKRALKPGGRLVIVEPIVERRRRESRSAQESSHEIEPRYVEEDLRQAGFTIVELRDPFTTRDDGDTEWMVIATPSSPSPDHECGATRAAPMVLHTIRRDARHVLATPAGVNDAVGLQRRSMVTDVITTSFSGLSRGSVAVRPIPRTTSIPSTTSPNTE
jgi:predicted methyltransferase